HEVSSKKSHWGVFGGYFLLTSLILGVFILYLQFHEKKIFGSLQQLLFMLMWLLVYSYLVFAVDANKILSVYLIPFCIVPIVIKIFYNERLALFTHIVVVLIASFLSSLGYEFTFLQILAGIVAVLSNIKVRDWTKFFVSMLYIFLAYSVGYLGLSLIDEGSLTTVNWSIYSWIFLNVFLTLLAYPLIPLLERVFGFTSAITLVELSDMDRPLLKELSIKAPGTLQHSLQVANLSEAAASKIGADQLLVKVAALYHDIGKVQQPAYYIENQSGANPHNKTTPLDSAKIIIEHVTEGVKLAKKNRLPKVLIDFIRTHHGTTRVEYFYRNHINQHPGGEVDEHSFRYPGPRPRSKEETILMIADSLEAASKSLKSPSEKDINDLVDKIIAGKITHGQLEDSEMTFAELEICKREFKKLLKSIYHVRIEYPEAKK
ncbi:MAG: HDIG domain-containing metalloprotein, partial [Bacteroidota bacterium]